MELPFLHRGKFLDLDIHREGENYENSLQTFECLDGYFGLHDPIEFSACPERSAVQCLCLRRKGPDLPRDRLGEQPARNPQGRAVGMRQRAHRPRG